MTKFDGDIRWFRMQSAVARACKTDSKPVTVPPTVMEIDRLLADLSRVLRKEKESDLEDQLLDMRRTLVLATKKDVPV